MRILCFTNWFPLPRDVGGAIRVFGLLRALAANNGVHLLASSPPRTREALVSELESMLDITVETFGPAPDARAPRPAGLWVRALVRGMPPWILWHFDEDMSRRVLNLIPKFDAVVALDDHAGAYVTAARATAVSPPMIADKHVVLGAAFAEQADEGWRARVRDRLARELTRSFERRYLRRVDRVVVTSEEEADRFEQLYCYRPEVVVSAIDPPMAVQLNGRSRSVGWLGSLDGRPIIEGLRRFVETAWQPLGSAGYELLIAGRSAPPSIRELERFPGVRLIGYVEQLEPFLDGLAAAVIPLWDGQGMKLKTLTLLGAGLPVAATPVALEGISAVDGRDCLVAGDPQGLADRLRRILSDDQLARRLGANGRRLVMEQHTWESVGPQFARVVADAIETRSAGRRTAC